MESIPFPVLAEFSLPLALSWALVWAELAGVTEGSSVSAVAAAIRRFAGGGDLLVAQDGDHRRKPADMLQSGHRIVAGDNTRGRIPSREEATLSRETIRSRFTKRVVARGDGVGSVGRTLSLDIVIPICHMNDVEVLDML